MTKNKSKIDFIRYSEAMRAASNKALDIAKAIVGGENLKPYNKKQIEKLLTKELLRALPVAHSRVR